MAVLNGNDLVLAIHSTSGSEVAFAHSQTASISFANSTIDATTKDSDSWEQVISGRKSFSVSADGLVDLDSVTSRTNTPAFSGYALAGTPVFFTFERAEGTLASAAPLGWSGSGIIESFDVSAASDDVVTYSVSIKGTGVLSPVVKA